MLHYDETRLPERPPALVIGAFLVDLAALKPTYATWGKFEDVKMCVYVGGVVDCTTCRGSVGKMTR